MPFVQLSSAAICLTTALLIQSAAQTDSPDAALPALTLDSLPDNLRRNIHTLLAEAQTRPQDSRAVGHLAMALHAHEQLQSASAGYRRARHLDSTSFEWAYLEGLVHARLGNFAAAAASLQDALSLDSAYLPARVALADALVQGGQLYAARAAYLALVRDYPELAVAHYGCGRVAAMLGDNAAALARYRKSVELAPQFGAAHYALALAYRNAGRRDRAVGHFDEYQRLGARHPVPVDPVLERVNAFRWTARHLIGEGARLDAAGRLDESIALHVKALEAEPTAAQAHVNLISLYGRKGERDLAQRHYYAALKLQGDHAGAHYNWGVLLAGAQSPDEAADAFRRAVAVNPFHPQAHNNLAALLAGQGKLEEAATHYKHALSNDPGHRLARFNLGRVLVAVGRPREATEHFEWLLVRESAETPRFTYALATAWLAAGEVDRFRRYAEQALEHARRLGRTELVEQIEEHLKRIQRP